jgi:ABC-2 type transport system permease protein
MPELARVALLRGRRSLVGWTIGFAATTVLTTAFYPSIKGDPSLNDTFNKLPESVRNLFGGLELTSAVGYLTGRLFSLVLPVMLLVFAIGRGASAIAGEEELHWLNLVLAHPVSRRSIVGQRVLALAIEVAVVVAATFVTLALLDSPAELDLALERLLAMNVSLAVLGFAMGGLALGAGAATGRRATATAVAAVVSLLSFLVDSLGKSIDVLRPLRPYTAWRWYLDNEPLRNGFDAVGMTVLVVAGIVFIAAGVVTFDRRDVRG